MSAQDSPASLSGLWQPRIQLKNLFYGSDCVENHLLTTLPSPSSKAFIITGTSLATKTPLVHQLEGLLGSRHAGTISNIGQHGPVADVEHAISTVLNQSDIDTIISLGGGTPIDTAKVISFRFAEKHGKYLTHLSIPTTLSAAECTAGGGYTQSNGVKIGFRSPEMGVSSIFYDPQYARYTPKELWLSTGIRALDHAVESIYHPTSTEVPWKALSIWAIGELFHCLPKARDTHPDNHDITTRLMLAAYASSGLKGENIKGGMGLSHSLGHALGSPYGIPHGITSCMTLGKVVKLKAGESVETARQICRLLDKVGGVRSGDVVRDASEVGDRIIALVQGLGLDVPSLTERGVGREEMVTITQRALGGAKEGLLFDQMLYLVGTLF